MEYLIGLGHRRIGFINGRPELISATRRLQGYADGLARAGLPYNDALIEIGDYTTETAVACTHTLLALDDPPTAIFAANDQTAMGVYQAAKAAGIRIPEDLSVVGFDNIRDSEFLNPALTTVNQFIDEMGYIATEMVVKLVKGEELESNLEKVSTQLVVRESCKAV